MKLVTWNVNSLKQRLPRVLELLAEHRPDVVCLQETKCSAEAFPHDELAEAGYAAAEHSAGRWAGVALLASREDPPHHVVAGLDGEAVPGEARWIEASIGPLRVASVYVPNGRALGTDTYAQKLDFLDAMGKRVAQLTAQHPHVVVAGDMNVAPEDCDVYDIDAFIGSTHVTAEERSRVAALGLVDTFRRVNPDAQASPGGTTAPGTSTRAWGCASTSFSPRRAWRSGRSAAASTATTARAASRATTLPCSPPSPDGGSGGAQRSTSAAGAALKRSLRSTTLAPALGSPP